MFDGSEKICLVLPLQGYIWSYDLNKWKKREEYKNIILSYNLEVEYEQMEKYIMRNTLYSSYIIGTHIPKLPSLLNTVKTMASDNTIPYQIYLSMKSHFIISDEEISECFHVVQRFNLKVFVHSPHIINLAKITEDNYVVKCLQLNLKIANSCGFSGVVVHVGKSMNMKYEDALENMKTNVLMSIESASEKCPLLIETPASQGTEMLTTLEELMEFITDINDERLRLCVDTCHVYSSNYLPSIYLNKVLENEVWSKYLKLIHFNDSMTVCNSHIDRHASLMCGKIPMDDLMNVAFIAQNYNIPLVNE